MEKRVPDVISQSMDEEKPLPPMGRNFRPVAEDELFQLMSFLSLYYPEALKFQETVRTYLMNKVWEFDFYVARDWPSQAICLHFPGMTSSPHSLPFNSVGVFCALHQLQLLQLLREEDVLIDWSKPLYINFVHEEIARALTQLYGDTGTVHRVVGDVFICENPERFKYALVTNEDDEDDIQVQPLQPEHVEDIYELYPAKDMECREIFSRLIKTLPSAGVFVNGSLAAWMVQSYYGAMFSMQTKPEYRRKGYGTKLVRYLTRQVAEDYTPFVVIRSENSASQSLFEKLGFKKLYQIVRMTFMPHTANGDESKEDDEGPTEAADTE